MVAYFCPLTCLIHVIMSTFPLFMSTCQIIMSTFNIYFLTNELVTSQHKDLTSQYKDLSKAEGDITSQGFRVAEGLIFWYSRPEKTCDICNLTFLNKNEVK